MLKRCVNWHEIVHNSGFQGTTCRQLQDIFSPQAKKNYILCINISSFGCFTILVHRNVKLLYKYVGPLASKNYPLYLLTNGAGSFGGYTILLHRNVILLHKYVGPLELMLCGYEGRLTLRFLKNLPPLILRWHLYSSTQKYQLIL